MLETMHTVTNGILRVQVDDLGANLTSLFDLRAEREVLWQADPAWWGHRSPLLFPIVGTLTGGVYSHQGKMYELPTHGFAREKLFSCREADASHVLHELCSDEETRAAYPFDFAVQVLHRLDGDRLRIEWDVRNTGTETMYFSIGAHPGFFCPLKEDERLADCAVDFHTDGTVFRRMLDGETHRAFPGQRELPLQDGRMGLSEHTFDDLAIILDDIPFDKFSLCGGNGKPYVTLHCKGFPYAGIWSPPGAPFVCLEPWYGRCDEMDASGELSEKVGILSLPVGRNWHTGYDIQVPEQGQRQ